MNINSTTRYVDLPDFKGYRIGTDGTIWSCWSRWGPGAKGEGDTYKQLSPNRILKNKGKYTCLVVHLKNAAGRRVPKIIARLVLETFVGPPPTPKHHASHKNNDPTDNHIDNLAWKTPKENNADQLTHGTRLCGANKGKAKLTDDSVRELIARRAAGESCKKLAEDYGINWRSVYRIVEGKMWAHIQRK